MQAKEKIKILVGNAVDKIKEKSDNSNFISLKNAVRFLNGQQVQKILNNNCYLINQTDDKYKTILDYALERGNLEVIKVIVDNKGKVSLSFYNAKTAFQLTKLFMTLEKIGYDLDTIDMLGFAPIHYASMKGNERALQFLMKIGVNIRAVDASGSSPLMITLKGKRNSFIVRGQC